MKPFTVIETIRSLQHCGRVVSSDGKQLFVGPGQELGEELAAAVREHRDELIRIFTPPPSEAEAEREAIRWADRRDNTEADAALAAASEWWRANALVAHAMQAFPGWRVRELSDAEYKAIGFREPRKQATSGARK
jgi:hypothetical protein